ncbi:MAG TPA: amidohydrolase family protein [Chloroflexota bacterium]
MIVDAHVELDSQRYPIDRALEVLASANITNAVIFAEARSADLAEQNRYVLDVAQRHNLYPFYYIGGNPWTDSRPDELEVPENLGEYAGIRWHRWVGTGIDRQGTLDRDELEWAVSLMESPEFEAITSAAAHYNLPVMFEESLSVTLEFVLRFPSLDIVIPHLGARSGGEANVLRELWDTPNVYFDTSLAQLDEITLARVGSERIFFGSGYPQGDPSSELDKIDRLPISEEVKEGIYGDNVTALLSEYGRIP